MKVLVSPSGPTLCNPMDFSLPDSSVHGILQARILEWVAIPFSRGSCRPGNKTQVSCTASRFLTICDTREALWLIHVVRQKPTQYCKTIILPLKLKRNIIKEWTDLLPMCPIPMKSKAQLTGLILSWSIASIFLIFWSRFKKVPKNQGYLPVSASHTVAVWSKEPVMILFPDVLKDKEMISAECP